MDQSTARPETGQFLIASPPLGDPNFRRSVVLICDHGEEGTFGLVLNRILDLTLDEVLEGVGSYSEQLSLGGPVEPNTLHYLHSFGEDVEGSIPVIDHVFWGGDFEQIKDMVSGGLASADNIRFFVGYSGWGPGQLQEEMEAGGWIVYPATSRFVFGTNPEKLWQAVLRDMGGDYALLSNFPDDPRLN